MRLHENTRRRTRLTALTGTRSRHEIGQRPVCHLELALAAPEWHVEEEVAFATVFPTARFARVQIANLNAYIIHKNGTHRHDQLVLLQRVVAQSDQFVRNPFLQMEMIYRSQSL